MWGELADQEPQARKNREPAGKAPLGLASRGDVCVSGTSAVPIATRLTQTCGEGTTRLACLGLDRTQIPSHSIIIMRRERTCEIPAGKCMRVTPMTNEGTHWSQQVRSPIPFRRSSEVYGRARLMAVLQHPSDRAAPGDLGPSRGATRASWGAAGGANYLNWLACGLPAARDLAYACLPSRAADRFTVHWTRYPPSFWALGLIDRRREREGRK